MVEPCASCVVDVDTRCAPEGIHQVGTPLSSMRLQGTLNIVLVEIVTTRSTGRDARKGWAGRQAEHAEGLTHGCTLGP